MLAYSNLTAPLHIMEPTARKSQNFAWRAPLGLTAEEQCGLFARTVDPSPWSIPIKYSNTRISVADATPTRFRPLPIFQPTSLNQLFITRSPASASSDLGLLLFFLLLCLLSHYWYLSDSSVHGLEGPSNKIGVYTEQQNRTA